ncbi:MAG: hypothetical protein JXN64_01755 [Spirochaetes bacterium]|nr:hypothetical protein [Spirochaetota bacterium]
MNNIEEKNDFDQIISKLIGEQKFGEAINYLNGILANDHKNAKALILMEQLKKYRNARTGIYMVQKISIWIPGLTKHFNYQVFYTT